MTQFILSYVDEQGEDIGALLQRLCVDIDKANYNLFWNYKFISIARQANEEEAKNLSDGWILNMVIEMILKQNWNEE